jgi:dihydroorotate dehydrogenase electron transfer subunit
MLRASETPAPGTRAQKAGGPFLRRPFGIHAANGKGEIVLLYQVLGPATELFSRKRKGDCLELIGPLGNGFDLSPASRVPVIVCGGMGVAPLGFLAQRLREKGVSRRPLVLIGAKTRAHLIGEQEFKKARCEVLVATDDGTKGYYGYVTELLRKLLSERKELLKGMFFACGPRPMLKELSGLAQEYSLPAQVSLEEHMSCGIGACLGCAVDTVSGYQRVCREGPVFKSSEIIW